MKHHDRYFVAASFLLAAFILGAMVDMGILVSMDEAYLLDWIGWILGMVGILMFGLALSEHKKHH